MALTVHRWLGRLLSTETERGGGKVGGAAQHKRSLFCYALQAFLLVTGVVHLLFVPSSEATRVRKTAF
jgi:hypothetical protein